MVEKTKDLRWRPPKGPESAMPLLLVCLCGMLVFGILAWTSLSFTRLDTRIAAVWVPNAVAVAFLLRFKVAKEQWFILALWVGNSIANILGGDPISSAAALAACNAIEIQVAAWLSRHWCGPTPNMQHSTDLLKFIGAATVIAPMVAAVFATITLGKHSLDPLQTWAKWSITGGLGMAIIAPGLMVIIDALKTRRLPTKARLLEWCIILALGIIATALVFGQSAAPLMFLTLPIVALHAFRLGAAGTAIGVATTAAVAIGLTASGLGPVNTLDASATVKMIVLQVYLAAAFLLGLPVAAMLAGRDRALQALADKQQELELLTDSITDAVLRYDNSGHCIYASRSVRPVLGEVPEAFIGQAASERVHPESQAIFAAAEKRMLSGQSDKERFIFRRRLDDATGRPIFIEADCAVPEPAAELPGRGIVISARDVTDRVELEVQLTRARRLAEEAARGKSEFLANMSHEIRTPMNGVLGFAELLSQSDLPAEQQHHANLIVQSGRSMMMLLNDILDLAKIEAGQISIEREATDLGALVSECARLHQASAQKKSLELHCEGPKHGPYIFTDGLRVRQILINLLSNAVKFTEQGSIVLSHTTREEHVLIAVEDTGIGILEERLKNIFEPFAQGESDISRRYGGTGLGLTISRQLAELLNGTLDVKSEPGMGSRFILTIPLERSENVPEAAETKEANLEDSLVRPLQPARILLAEDHDINRMLVKAMLERCGQRVSIACDGEQAIETVLEAHSKGLPFDLVLMDIQMPGCDGYTATRAIRSEGVRASELPIIALTANAYPEDIAAARECGMQGHLAKPLAFADLVHTLQRWLPVRIVDQSDVSGASEVDIPAEQATNTVNSPSLVNRWKVRRRETLDAVNAALKKGQLEGDDAEALAKLVHTLAGTAGMFGEAKLGQCASEFERSLKSESGIDERRILARKLLNAAQSTGQPRSPETE